MAAILVTYLVTMAVFPGVATEVESCAMGPGWLPVLMLAAYNCSDLVGKMVLAPLAIRMVDAKRRVSLALGRAMLIPLLAACAAPRHAPILSADFFPLTLALVIGATNGASACASMVDAPVRVAKKERESAGALMTLSLGAGLALGSCLAYGLESTLGTPQTRDCLVHAVTEPAEPPYSYVTDEPAYRDITDNGGAF